MAIRLLSTDEYNDILSSRGITPDSYDAVEAPVEEPETKPITGLQAAGRGLVHGIASMGDTLVGTPMQYIGNRIGSDLLTETGKETGDYWRNKAKEYEAPKELQGNVIDNPELLANTAWWMYNIADQVPNFMATIIPAAGVGKMVQVGAKAIKWTPTVAENLTKLTLLMKGEKGLEAGTKAVRIAQGITAGTIGGTMEASSEYQKVLEKGGTEEEAARTAEAMGAGVGVLNALGADKVLAKAGGSFMGRVVKRLGAGAWEGLTEGAEEPWSVFSNYMGKYLSGEKVPDDIMPDLIQSFKDAATVAPVAAVTGFGGAMMSGKEETAPSKNKGLQTVPQSTETTQPSQPIDLLEDQPLPQPQNVDIGPALQSASEKLGMPIPQGLQRASGLMAATRPPLVPGFQGPVQVNPRSGGWAYQEEPAIAPRGEVAPSHPTEQDVRQERNQAEIDRVRKLGRLPEQPIEIQPEQVETSSSEIYQIPQSGMKPESNTNFLDKAAARLGGKIRKEAEARPIEHMGKRSAMEQLKLNLFGRAGKFKPQSEASPEALRQQETFVKNLNWVLNDENGNPETYLTDSGMKALFREAKQRGLNITEDLEEIPLKTKKQIEDEAFKKGIVPVTDPEGEIIGAHVRQPVVEQPVPKEEDTSPPGQEIIQKFDDVTPLIEKIKSGGTFFRGHDEGQVVGQHETFISDNFDQASQFAGQKNKGQVTELKIDKDAKVYPVAWPWQEYQTNKNSVLFKGYDAVPVIEPNGQRMSLAVLNENILQKGTEQNIAKPGQAAGELTEDTQIKEVDVKAISQAQTEAGGPGVVKQPWEMTKRDVLEDYAARLREAGHGKTAERLLSSDIDLTQLDRDSELSKVLNSHKEDVKKAQAESLPVPEKVLADYPDLQPTSKEGNISKNISKPEIEKWSRIIEKQGAKGVERLRSYVGSLVLGRDFNEKSDAFFKRKGLTEFVNWADQHLKSQPTPKESLTTVKEQPKAETYQEEMKRRHDEQYAGWKGVKLKEEAVPKGIKKGEIGGKLGTGEVQLTATGRKTTPFPKLSFGSEGKTRNTAKRVDNWLIDNAIEEAKSRNDRFNLRQFEGINRKNISQSDKDSAELYLFGDNQPKIVPSILNPLTPAKEKGPTTKKEQAKKVVTPEELKAEAKKKQFERMAKNAQNAPNFRAWIRAKGGLTTPTMRDHGLLDDNAYIGIRNKNGMGIDEMIHMAIDDGWLQPGATEEDFVDAIIKNPKKVTGDEKDLLKSYEGDYDKYVENLEQEARNDGASDEQLEEVRRSSEEDGIHQADENFKASSDADEAELVSIFGKDWDKPTENVLVLTQEEGTAWDKGEVKNLGPQGKKAVFPTEKIKPAEYKNQENMFGPQKRESLDLFGQGETKLNLTPNSLTSEAFKDHRKAVLQFRKWMHTAGLSKEQLANIDVEVKNAIKIIGNVRKSELEHGKKATDLSKVLGSTTFFDDASVLVQYSANQNLISGEDTAYHEAFHVMLARLVSDENRTALLEHYHGNEENAAKAFSKFVVNEETTTIPKAIKKIFYQIKRALVRIANGFRQSGYKTPEDFFRALYFGAYKGQGETSGINEFAQSVKLSLDKAVKKITDNPNFVKWFGDSKVVDESGEPLVVYHGTGKKFTAFNTESGAVWFTDDALDAADYAYEHETPSIMPVFLSIKNPFKGKIPSSIPSSKIDELKVQGYDGWISEGDAYIAFNPTQIKSIYNQGTFDPNNPDIRLQVEAWHGSPHEWEGGKADLSKVGTGEGAQAFGHGLYFTELEDIAKHYAEGFGKGELKINGRSWDQTSSNLKQDVQFWIESGNFDYMKDMLSLSIKNNEKAIGKSYYTNQMGHDIDVLRELNREANKGEKSFYDNVSFKKLSRNLYKVTLHKGKQPGDYTWLDWDKPLSQQRQATKKAIQFMPKSNATEEALKKDPTGEEIYAMFSYLPGHFSDKEASLFLLRAGIDGIRYPAGSLSGGKGEAKNYVVFDEKAVTVEAHTKFNLKPEPRIDYIGEMENVPGKPNLKLYNIFGVEGMKDGSTVSENTLKKLGLIPDQAETKLNIAETAKEFHADMRTFTGDAIDAIKNISDTRKIWSANKASRKADTTFFDRYFRTPFFSFRKVDTAWRMFEDGQKRSDNFYEQVDNLTKTEDGQYWTIKLDNAKRQIPEEYKKIKAIFKRNDQNKIGYTVRKDEGTEFILPSYTLSDPKGKEVGKFASEAEAWEQAIQGDLASLKAKGYSDQGIDAAEAIMRMRHNGFNLLSANIKSVIAEYERLGIPLPVQTVWDNGEKIEVNLKNELARMGDMRGYYMPRSWKPGRIILYARKKGVHPRIEIFDLELTAANRQRQLQAEGYSVKSKISGPMPEDVFEMAGQTVAVNAMLNEALDRLKKAPPTLDSFGLKGELVDGPGKNKDFMLIGPTNKRQGKVLKDMGGKWYQAKEGIVEHWHFVNTPKDFEKRLIKALGTSEVSRMVDEETAKLFAGGLAEQVGNIIKERGSRKHMIKRSDAVGLEVWEGYEEDPAIAMTQYVRGLAAGEAKHKMAIAMVQHMTGTDVSWSDYKNMIEEETGSKPEYDEYLNFVNNRRIDPVQQPNIFKDATAFMKDMLRNQETSDRVIGVVKGLAVLKYLGFKLSALPINMSAMVSTVPASMKGYANIEIGKSFSLMAKMSKLYIQFRRYQRTGNKALLPQRYIDLFEEMEKKGWGKPQFNREALSTLESKVGRGYSKLIEMSMVPFAITETFNRMVTISSAYEGARAQGKTHEEALAIGKDVSDHAHAVYGKVNYPHLLRGDNLAAQTLKCGYVFKQFNHNYLQTMWDLGYNKKDAKATMWMAASPMFLGGLGAFAGTALIKAALQALGADDPEEWFYNQVEENLGQKAGTVARVGVPGLFGVSLKGSLSIDLTGIPTSPAELLGAPGSVIGDIYEGGKQLSKGNASKGAEKLLPAVLASPMKAIREAREGVTTSGNLPVYYGNKPLMADTADAVIRFLGFSPAHIATAREKQWNERLIEQKYTARRAEIYGRFHRFYLMPTEDRTKANYLDLLDEIRQYNNDLVKSGLTKKGYSPITNKLLRANIKRGFKPSKKERLREGR